MKQNSVLKVLGITGGAGSGKSTVSDILEGYGAKIICADRISKQIMHKDYQVYYDILNAFGETVISPNGEIDRAILGDIVFNDSGKLMILNDITHKHIAKHIYDEIAAANDVRLYTGIVVDAALPLKNGFIDVVDAIWTVIAHYEYRIGRLIKRGNYNRDKAIAIIESQMSEQDYIKLADAVIENNDSMDELRNKVEVLWSLFLTGSK